MLERINLVPQLLLADRIKKITPIACGFLLAAGCAAVFFWGRQIENDNVHLKNEIALLESRQAVVQAQQQAIISLNAKQKQMRQQELQLRKIVAALLEIPKKKPHHSEVLIALSSVLPDSVRCEKIVLDEGRGQITGKAIVYRDLPSFVQQLDAMPEFYSVSLQVLNQSEEDERGLLAFSIVFGLK